MADRFWVSNGGNWSDTGHWSTTSGGSSGASVPTSTDNAVFDDNSFSTTGQTVTMNVSVANCLNLDFSGLSAGDNPAFHIADSCFLEPRGNIIFQNMTVTGANGGILMVGSGITHTVTTNGVTLDIGGISCNDGFFLLGDDLITTGAIGTSNTVSIFDTQSFNLTARTMSFSDSDQVRFGASTITLNPQAGDTVVSYDEGSVGTTLVPGTSTIEINMPATGQVNFWARALALADVTFYDGVIHGGGHGSTLYFGFEFDVDNVSNIIWHNLTIDQPPTTVLWRRGTSVTTSTFTANGNAIDGQISIASNVPGTPFTINADTVDVSYITVTDSTAGGAAADFNASNGGVDGGGNSNWNFTTPPSEGSLLQVSIPLVVGTSYRLSVVSHLVSGFPTAAMNDGFFVYQGTTQIGKMASVGYNVFDFTADSSGNSIKLTPDTDELPNHIAIDTMSVREVIVPAPVYDGRPVIDFLTGNTDFSREIFFRVDTQPIQMMPDFETFANPVAIVTKLQRGTLVKCFVAIDQEDFYPLEGNATKGTSIVKIHSRAKGSIPTPPIARKIRVSWRDSSKMLVRISQGAILFLPTTMDYSE